MRNFLLFIAALTMTLVGSSQDRPAFNRGSYFSAEMRSYDRAMASKVPVLKLPDHQRSLALPVSVDNSQHKFFPGILDQGYNMTCQQFAGVSYLFAYEINRLRNVSASEPENQYPEKYTYNFMNGGNAENGVSFFYSWDAIKRQGHPGADVFPGIDTLSSYGWMTGYDKYYSAMKNRLKQVYSIPVNTEEGILTLKHYLFNHLDGSSTGGIAVLGTSANFYGNIQPIPEGSPEAGKGILTGFFPLATHGLTIVGYNDSIRFDLNADGRYTNDLDITGDGIVNPKDWEKGAYRVANSYGITWEDSGYCWMMYRAFALDYDEGLSGWTSTCGVWNEAVYTLEPIADYIPLLTIKVSLNHTRRNMISVKAGISANAASQLPEYIMEFPIWDYQGGEMPLNVMHPELPAMEAGFDITPLLSYVEPGKACRLFFILDENDPDNKATGAIETVSFISYLNGTSVIPAGDTDVAITNNSSTLLSAVFTPEFNKVRITNEDLPPYIPLQPYSFQMQAEGGTPPYNWSLLKPSLKIQTDSLYPLINQQELFPQSIAVPYHQVILPFAFPFQGKE
ncbi:MAG TPA: hypothetical protein VLR52_03880, partial [Bacteroidales bacterium]|nr:hypothetical protein [Bacteroidales bacterium]